MTQLPFQPWCNGQQRIQAQAEKTESHQMYRTIKTTDRPTASSGQSDGLKNGSAGEISDELVPDVGMDPRCWSNRAEPPCITTRVHPISIWEAFISQILGV